MKRLFLFLFLSGSIFSHAQDTKTATDDLFDMSLEQLLNLELVDKNFYLYGYINSNLQKTFDYPSLGDEGEVVLSSDPMEWSPIKNFHIYGQGNLTGRISYLFNLAGNDDGIEIRNAWGNFQLRELLQVRLGKMYRKFGLYNERLDQIPTFIGIEPPEMLDSDHLFLSRTTSVMLHGHTQNAKRKISYALMTDNGEAGPVKNLIPLGWDIRYTSFTKSLIIGASGYHSSVTKTMTTSTVQPGSGPPQGGILPWMAGDRFSVVGAFIEKQLGNLLVQAEYSNASHRAVRNPAAVLQVVREASVNPQQRRRFLGARANASDDELTIDDVILNTKYNVQTFYVRMGYNIQHERGQFIPYVMVDWMSNPEVIQKKAYGGDEEAGLADDGKFLKPSVGIVYRPIQNVAIKLDGSYHIQQYNGQEVAYPELRLDFSFAFSNHQIQKALGN